MTNLYWSGWKLHWKKGCIEDLFTNQYSITTFYLKVWGDLLHLWLLSSVLAEENGVKLVQILAEWPLTTHISQLCFAFYCDKMEDNNANFMDLKPRKLHWIKKAGAQVWLCPGHSCLWVRLKQPSGKRVRFLLWKLSQPLFVFSQSLFDSVSSWLIQKGVQARLKCIRFSSVSRSKFSVVLMIKRGCRNIATWHDSAWDPDGAQVLIPALESNVHKSFDCISL